MNKGWKGESKRHSIAAKRNRDKDKVDFYRELYLKRIKKGDTHQQAKIFLDDVADEIYRNSYEQRKIAIRQVKKD